MPKIQILSDKEISEFDNPPIFDESQRRYFFCDGMGFFTHSLQIVRFQFIRLYHLL
jgi:hypothetical protein